MIDENGVPRLLRKQRCGDRFVGNDGGARAPALQAPRQQGGFDRGWRDDENSAAGKIGDGERRRFGVVSSGQRNADGKCRACAGRALDRDRAR